MSLCVENKVKRIREILFYSYKSHHAALF